MRTLGTRSKKSLQGVHPKMVAVIEEAIKESPIDFTVVCGVRTDKEQQDLYALGRTKPGKKVTQKDGIKNRSNHQTKKDGYGYAVDLYPYVDGKVQIEGKHVLGLQKQIAAHIKAVAVKLGTPITWGGDWKTPFDAPHFELKA